MTYYQMKDQPMRNNLGEIRMRINKIQEMFKDFDGRHDIPRELNDILYGELYYSMDEDLLGTITSDYDSCDVEFDGTIDVDHLIFKDDYIGIVEEILEKGKISQNERKVANKQKQDDYDLQQYLRLQEKFHGKKGNNV